MKQGTDCRYSDTETRQIRLRYEQLSQRKSAHEELVNLLKNATEQDASEIVHRLRAGIDVASIVTHVRDGNLLLQLSLAPDTRRIYQFPYSSKVPAYLSSVKNPYLDSLLFKAAFSPPDAGSSTLSGDKEFQTPKTKGYTLQRRPAQRDKRQSVADKEKYHSAYVVPYHAARMIEPVLEKITAKPWTSVIFDSELIRRLIRSYFCYPHPSRPFCTQGSVLGRYGSGPNSVLHASTC